MMIQMVTRQRWRLGSADAAQASKESTPRWVYAALAIFVGVSAANAMGGLLQLVFLCLCLGVMLLRRHQVPIGLMGGVVLCGMIATFSSLRVDLSIAPLLRFGRPFVEGYLLAILLYHGCRIRTLNSLLGALGSMASDATSIP